MKSNRINLLDKFLYYLKGYKITSVRSYYDPKIQGGSSVFHKFKMPAYLVIKEKGKGNNKERKLSIITESKKVILKEGNYIPLDANENHFVVYNNESGTICYYSYDGIPIYVVKTDLAAYQNNYYELTPREEEKNQIFVYKDSDTKLYQILDNNANIIMDNISGITSYFGQENTKILAIVKDNLTYIMSSKKDLRKVDCVIELNSYQLPISVGIKNEKEECLDKYFITTRGKFIDKPFRKIEYAGDKICWRIMDESHHHNYIMPDGSILLKKHMHDITRFHYGYAFVSESINSFYDMIDDKGNILPRNEKILIRSTETGFRNVYIRGEMQILALVNVREFLSDNDPHIYKDYQCFVTRDYKFIPLNELMK